MTFSVLKSLATPATLYDNFLFLLTNSHLKFDPDSWAAALPRGKAGTTVDLGTSLSGPDGSISYGLVLKGDFSKTDSTWSGPVTRAIMKIDGETVGVLQVNSGIDLSRIVNVQPSTLIWNELTNTGVRGKLTPGADNMNGSVTDDILNGARGDDSLNGGLGDDRLIGGLGNDHLDGHAGDDRLLGGGGDDFLFGKDGSDRLFGQAGKDTFFADSNGDNVWTGGKGADLFQPGAWFGAGDVSTTITDFNKRQGDQIDLSNDSYLLFNFADVDEIRYIGKKAFSGTEGRFEIRMKNGYVEIDQNGDGIADRGLLLEGQDTFAPRQTDWLLLPDGFDFG
ncbi:calcium-binding protein [Pseudodonghicola flavimaris]|uniref:Calcium-binding protein n=1 Tax=Pseudodonghicola flavimaris TaxID=3050036 RepID=A0ABT7EZB4_9RHOB|nr:hypothetical protein [Pseudodonghicola flavimaris]MDK3017682.1 hypothetical protein [Pseudodonghicola flavimaris]